MVNFHCVHTNLYQYKPGLTFLSTPRSAKNDFYIEDSNIQLKKFSETKFEVCFLVMPKLVTRWPNQILEDVGCCSSIKITIFTCSDQTNFFPNVSRLCIKMTSFLHVCPSAMPRTFHHHVEFFFRF